MIDETEWSVIENKEGFVGIGGWSKTDLGGVAGGSGAKIGDGGFGGFSGVNDEIGMLGDIFCGEREVVIGGESAAVSLRGEVGVFIGDFCWRESVDVDRVNLFAALGDVGESGAVVVGKVVAGIGKEDNRFGGARLPFESIHGVKEGIEGGFVFVAAIRGR